jgi:hypothetical protein
MRYPARIGRIVHSLALPAVLLSSALLCRAKTRPHPTVAVLQGAGLWLAAVVLGITLPAALGALRVALTGTFPCTTAPVQKTCPLEAEMLSSCNVHKVCLGTPNVAGSAAPCLQASR